MKTKLATLVLACLTVLPAFTQPPVSTCQTTPSPAVIEVMVEAYAQELASWFGLQYPVVYLVASEAINRFLVTQAGLGCPAGN